MGPHAVRQVTVNGVNRVYAYDNNGNLTSGGGRQVFWNVHNKPSQINDSSGTWTAFSYGASGERIAQYLSEPCSGCGCVQPATNTYYIGGLLEKITKNSTNLIEYRHYVQAGGTTVAVHTAWSNGNTRDEYVHHDHLGSVTTLTSSTGAVVDRFSYDPWGKRRNAMANAWLAILPGSQLIPTSLANLTRGFTGHEHLDRVGLIHMNGRIYDPELGRFLSADPILQFPASTQGLDRYAYVLNNPVSLSDPSGHFVWGIAAAALGAWLGVKVHVALGILTAALGGYLETGSLKAAIFSAISASFSFGVGTIGAALKEGILKTLTVAVLHGLTQGILAVAQGGKFGAGFLSAAASSAFGPKGSGAGISEGKRLLRIVQSAAVGGTASRVGGGKFANGAVTGAFVQAFNDQLHGDAGTTDLSLTDGEKQLLADGNYLGFWESRNARGDPVASTALDVINNRGVGGKIANLNLRAKAWANGVDLSGARMDELRLSIARSHAEFTDGSARRGFGGHLSAREVARYHHEVFGTYGLPKTTFGGTPLLGGALWQADVSGYAAFQWRDTRGEGWCYDCRR